MATIEERLQALEQGHTELKKTIELQSIAIHAFVSKEAFEKLQDTVEKSQEQNNKLFDTLIAHDQFTNERLADLQNQIIELDNKLDGKIVGLQTEMRQRFSGIDARFEKVDARFNTMDKRFEKIETDFDQVKIVLAQILERLPER